VANPFVHVELNTPDPKKAKEFYSKLFQLQLEDVPNHAVPNGTYRTASSRFSVRLRRVSTA
jgi:predicted enzyme related to lactoylglutathione lyase